MKLYQSFEGQLVFSDDMQFAYDYTCPITNNSEKVYTQQDISCCLDDSLSDIEYFTEENANDLKFFKLWYKARNV